MESLFGKSFDYGKAIPKLDDLGIDDDGNFKQLDFKSDIDVVTEVDFKCEETISKILREETPDYGIIAEEGTNFPGEKVWIVDPLDGSLNFSRSIPLCCISIALWKEMEPLIGVVYDFNRDEMFTGLVGEGAWMNGKQINISNIKDKNNAILCTGFPVNTDFSDKALLDFVRDVQSYKKIRLLGSAALSLAYVASGRADVYHEKDIAIWDVAAGIAIVKASGGDVQFNPSKDENRLIVKAANNLLLSVN